MDEWLWVSRAEVVARPWTGVVDWSCSEIEAESRRQPRPLHTTVYKYTLCAVKHCYTEYQRNINILLKHTHTPRKACIPTSAPCNQSIHNCAINTETA